MSKGWLRSKTAWVNVVVAAVVAAVGAMTDQSIIDGETAATGMAVLNLFLRKLTDRPVEGVL